MQTLAALALFGTLGTTELILIFLVLLLLFGASKLPQLGGAFGKTIKNFKKEMKDGMAEEGKPAGPKTCAKCGVEVKESDSSFCPKCGQALS